MPETGGAPGTDDVIETVQRSGELKQRALQRRTVLLLSAAQLLSGLGNGAALAIGSLLAVDFSGSDAWAGSVTTVVTLSAAVVALPLSTLASRRGRRLGLVTGLLLAAAGALLIVLATMLRSLPVLLFGAALLGAGSAVNLQSRFAAVDLAHPDHRGRDLSLVVWSITVGAVAGPNLIKPGAALGTSLGLPAAAGPFLISFAGMALAAVLLFALLRPDPLFEARKLSGTAAPGPRRPRLRDGLRVIRGSRAALLGLIGVIAAHGSMVAVMSMTPLHLQQLIGASSDAVAHGGHGGSGGGAGTDSFVIIGFTISLHIAGMYALSPVMGWLSDRFGRVRVLWSSHVLLLLAVAVAGLGAASIPAVTAGLVLLGLGWSAATIAGSALLAESVDDEQRVLAQGASDTLMGLSGAVGGAGSGLLMALIGYPGLAAAAAVLSCVVLGFVILSRRVAEGLRA